MKTSNTYIDIIQHKMEKKLFNLRRTGKQGNIFIPFNYTFRIYFEREKCIPHSRQQKAST